MDIEIDNFTSKEALKCLIGYMQSERLSTVELLTAQSLLQINDTPGLSQEVGRFDMVLPGDAAVLEAAGAGEGDAASEAKKRRFLKGFLQYLHKNHKRVYLLVDSGETEKDILDYLEYKYRGIEMAGLAKVSASDRRDDMLVNAVNGADADCVLTMLESPLQEEFIVKNRCRMNARLCLAVGKDALDIGGDSFGMGRLASFLIRMIFRKEVERKRTKDG